MLAVEAWRRCSVADSRDRASASLHHLGALNFYPQNERDRGQIDFLG